MEGWDHHFMQMMGLYRKGGKISHVINCMQEAIQKVSRWTYNWGFKMSVSKSCNMIFTKKRKMDKVQLTLYQQNLERAGNLNIWDCGLMRNTPGGL